MWKGMKYEWKDVKCKTKLPAVCEVARPPQPPPCVKCKNPTGNLR